MYGFGGTGDYKQILENLRVDDEWTIYSNISQLQAMLSVASEQTMAGFPLDQYLATLINILKKPVISDVQPDINFMTVQSLTSLMDIFPTICNAVVSHGGVTALVQIMESSFGFVELAEACIRALEKISMENPQSVLSGGGIQICFNMIDFFVQNTQLKILKLALNSSKAVQSEIEFDKHLMPIIPILCNMIGSLHSEQDRVKIEHISSLLKVISESFHRFLSPHSQLPVLTKQYEKLLEQGLIDNIMRAIKNYIQVYYSHKIEVASKLQEAKDQNLLDIQKQESASGQQQKTYTDLTITNFLRTLQKCCKYSEQVIYLVIGSNSSSDITDSLDSDNFLYQLDQFLPKNMDHSNYNADNFPFINDTVALLDDIFPERLDESNKQSESTPQNKNQNKIELENMKREYFLNVVDEKDRVFIAQNLLPKIFHVYESNIQQNFRQRTLFLIEKLIYLLSDEMLKLYLEPNSFSKFIFSLLQSNQASTFLICLKLIDHVLKSNGSTYYVPLVRKGVSQFLKSNLTSQPKLQSLIGKDQFNLPSTYHSSLQNQFFAGSQPHPHHSAADNSLLKIKDLMQKNISDLEQIKDQMASTGKEQEDLNKVFEMFEKKIKKSESEIAQQENKLLLQAQQSQQDSIKDDDDESEDKEMTEDNNNQQQQQQQVESNKEEKSLEEKKEDQQQQQQVQEDSLQEKCQGRIIMKQAQKVLSDYFENQEFIQANTKDSAEMKLFQELKVMAQMLYDEMVLTSFDEEKNGKILEKLVEILTDKRAVMCYEFRESGLLDALSLYLSKTPSQARAIIEIRKAKDKGTEELKHSEEIELSELSKKGEKISKKDARTYLLRLKKFTLALLPKVHSKSPFQQLIQLNHDMMSQYENLLFNENGLSQLSKEGLHGISDHQQSIHASRQLTKRIRVNLVYDANLSHLQKDSGALQKKQPIDAIKPLKKTITDFNQIGKQAANFDQIKALGVNDELKGKDNQSRSKVYLKRNYLFQQLKQVPVSVEQCGSLQLLEEFLRNRIKSIDEVKQLAIPTHSQMFSQLFKNPHDKTSAALTGPNSSAKTLVLDKAIHKLKKMLTSGPLDTQHEAQSQFINDTANEIANLKALSEGQQSDLIKQLESDSFQLIEEFSFAQAMLQQEDSHMRDEQPKQKSGEQNQNDDEDEMQKQELLEQQHNGEGEEGEQEEDELLMQETEKKIYEYHLMIEKLKKKFKEIKTQKSSASSKDDKDQAKKPEDETMEENKKEDQQIVTETKPTEKTEDMEMVQDDQQKQQDEENEEEAEEEEVTQQDMMYQFIEQAKQMKEQLHEKHLVQLTTNKDGHDEEGGEEEMEEQADKDIINTDLDELIKQNGEDVEFEFYYNGKLLPANLILFQIMNKQQQEFKKPISHTQDRLKDLFSNFNSDPFGFSSDQLGNKIYFRIVDKQDEIKQLRADSLSESIQKQRSQSEAINDVSSQSVNTLVKQLLQKEFNVFDNNQFKKSTDEILSKSSQKISQDSKEADDQGKDQQNEEDFKSLEQCIKILKVLNFVFKNGDLLSNDGLKFLLKSEHNALASESSEEAEKQNQQDNELRLGLLSLNNSMFHHHKLDIYLQRCIKDPYNLIGGAISENLQQIFRSCSFLFQFQTKELYFKLVSFIGAIDMSRSIYFLRQFLKSKGHKLQAEEKEIKLIKQKVQVDRKNILSDAIKVTKRLQQRAFLEIEYQGEEGTGLGPTLEFYNLVADEIKNATVEINDKSQSLWRQNQQNFELYPAPIDMTKVSYPTMERVHNLFKLAGTMIAKSIVDNRLIDLPLSRLMWDLLLSKKLNLFDLNTLDQTQFKLFSELQVLANKVRELKKLHQKQPVAQQDQLTLQRQIESIKLQNGASVEDLCLYFTLPGYDDIQLRPDGDKMQVTIENLQEYIDLVLSYTFHDSIKVQLQAFKKGFNQIFPIDCLLPFDSSSELESMICGTLSRNESDWSDKAILYDNIKPDHGYYNDSPQFHFFIRYITELPQEMRKTFLRFITGSPRLPNGGFQNLQPRLTLVLKHPNRQDQTPDCILPSVMTCQNYIKMPAYTSFEVLKMRFDTACKEGANNFTLS